MRMKKFLAFLIVMALTASLIPTAFAEGEVVKNYNYVFNSAAHSIGSAATERRLTSGLHTIENTVESVSSPWGFVNAYGFNGLASTNSPACINWTIKDENGAGVVFAPGESSVSGVRAALAFKISASKGTYDASFSVNHTGNEAEVEVYLIPKTDYAFPEYDKDDDANSKANFYKCVENMSANYRVGKVDLYGDDLYIGRVNLTQEDYYLVLVPCGVNEESERDTNNLWTMQLTNFKLDGVSENTAEKQDITSEAIPTSKSNHREWSYTKRFAAKVEENVLTAYNACIYSYGLTGHSIPLVVMKFKADKTGEYNLQLKTNLDGVSIKKFAAAPLVSYAKYDETFETNINNASSKEEIVDDSIEKFKSLTGYRGEIGYFDFSSVSEANTYYDVKKDGTNNGENGVLNLVAGEEYFLAFSLDSKSIAIANGTIEADVYTEGEAKGNEGIVNYTTPDKVYRYQAFIISGINLVPVIDERTSKYTADRELYNTLTSVTAENNAENTLTGYSSTATVSVVTQDIATGESVVNDVVNENVAVNAEYTPVAPVVDDDYEFMYWAIGLGKNRKIVSIDKDEYSFTVAPGRNLVYAVYRKTSSDTKYAFFFDGSKTVMGKTAIVDGQITLPALPGAMPGFGAPEGWKYTGEEDEAALSAGTTVSDLTDDTFFVADYDKKQTVTLTIDGEAVAVSYGTDVNLGDYASIRENKSGENVFNYWKKGEEIISFKPDYTFKAYEDCTLTSTYAKYEPINKSVRRILLSADAMTGITFAEFIGLDSAIEKGILFGDAEATYTTASAKAVMQTNGKVFSVVNETWKTAVGYAILNDGSIVYSDR